LTTSPKTHLRGKIAKAPFSWRILSALPTTKFDFSQGKRLPNAISIKEKGERIDDTTDVDRRNDCYGTRSGFSIAAEPRTDGESGPRGLQQ
jgi:hypothetical protein